MTMEFENDIQSSEIANFGKIFHLTLNDMSLILFKKEYGYQAVCIDLLLDSTGKNAKEACDNLMNLLSSYTKQIIVNHNGDKKEAFEYITQTAYTNDPLKSQYYIKYRQAKCQYAINRIAMEKRARSRMADFLVVLGLLFINQQIKYRLTVATA